KGRIWDSKGKLIARKEAQPDDTPGFKIEDSNWNAVEVAIPWSLIGGEPALPAGQTWKFVVAAGQQDNDIARKVEEKASEWYGGGGAANGVNPSVYDLAGSDKATQEKELGSYDENADEGDPRDFATIDKSYLTVNFGLMK
ncbi:MAG: glucodextranase DOMON-like domain-containing protein, partial [Candidatus Omnitrophota bacterium]|nr:glucodextranase DOMON-like domain-containing protein [Candidatus Omnitrophota bacterium]